MKFRICVLLLICSNLISKAQSPISDPNWHLIYTENFNTLNTSSTGWGIWNATWEANNFGFYTERANINTTTFPGNNVLDLSALLDYAHTEPISSGMIISKNAYLYGYFEARINFATIGPSYMPAFWLMDALNCDCPSSGPVPACTGFYDEIDIEIFTNNNGNPFEYTSNFWWGRPTESCPRVFSFESHTPSPGLQNSFHKYAIEWTPDHVILYYDDVPIRIKTDHVPSHPMKIWLDVGFRGTGYNSNTFPGHMYVDYVKVYDQNISCQPYTGALSGFDYKTRKEINLSGGYTNVLSGTDNVTLRASDFILISDDLTVPSGADFTILPNSCY